MRTVMDANPVNIWNTIVSALRDEVPHASFQIWLADVEPLSFTGEVLAIGVPDPFTKGGIERRYRETIERIAAREFDRPLSLDVRVVDDGRKPTPPQLGREEMASQPRDTLPLNPDYTFESFVSGKNNQLAYAASMAVVDTLGKAYNPLFIYGDVGLGKTHLLQAIGNRVAEEGGEKAIVYTTSERFAIELINAIRTSTTAAFRAKYRKIDLLLIDDVHFLEGKEATQEELFHTFNELYGRQKQIVLSSDRQPEDLSGVQERLVSRFRWGLVADIKPPDFETRIAILRKKAINRGVEVNDDVLALIASRISSNVRALEGALNKAIAYAELEGVHLTPTRLEEMLPKEGQRPRLTIEHIKEEVALRYHLKRRDLEGTSRKKEISQARHIAIFLSREMTDNSFPAIGREFGNRDHTTIMHSYMKVKTLLEETPLVRAEINEIKEALAARYAIPGLR
ncbi:chromosomal replication initiator protein DnaA [Candidatus Acetothermia bacterium]|nr:MAG: chromosomal replication initiator protein DnaA [Candidatus Acetothermia bacterium]